MSTTFPAMVTHEIDLSASDSVGITGTLVEVKLPSGITASLWIFDSPDTTSVDVRAERNGEMFQMSHVSQFPWTGEMKCASVVVENR